MSFLSPPDVPDAGAVANQQQQYNTQAAQTQNKTNSYNQVNPFGSQTYIPDPTSPSGYTLNTALSAPLQKLFNVNTGTAGDIAANSAGMYSQPYDLNAATGATASTLNKWNKQYLDPLFQQQDSNLEAQLWNQGLTPGSTAYNNAKNLLARNQGDVTNDYLSKNENQAFNQTLTNYMLPLTQEQALMGLTPKSPTFGATPTAQVQPPNYTQAAYNSYNAQNQQYQNMMSGLGQVAGVGGQAAGMFAGGWG